MVEGFKVLLPEKSHQRKVPQFSFILCSNLKRKEKLDFVDSDFILKNEQNWGKQCWTEEY